MTGVSQAATVALNHLKTKKPNDGWSLESKQGVVRLLRRNVPLTDNFFLDIHFDDRSGFVVGILTTPKNNSKSVQAQIVVDKHGKPVGKVNLITISSYNPGGFTTTTNADARRTTTTTSSMSRSSTNSASNAGGSVSDEDNKKIIQYGIYIVIGSVVSSIVSRMFFSLYIILIPILYWYALQTCPNNASFDAKKELKRVLRGHHLPEDHPEKPKKDFFSQTFARFSATVATELATGLGYEVSLQNMAGALTLATVRVPTTKQDFYWVGAFSKWHYVYASQYED